MILRTELRRSTAPVLGIGLVLVSVGLLYGLTGPWGKRTAPWNEQWIGLAQWTRYMALFLTPLVMGVGAWQGLREQRSGVPELFTTTPKTTWRRVLPTVGALAIASTAGYVVLLVIGGVQVAGTASYFHLKWVPVAGVMVLALVALTLLGAAVGRLVPSPVTPPVLAVAALAVQFALLQTGWPQMLTPAFDTPDISVFTSVAVPVTLTQTLWFTGIAATGFGLLVASRARSRVFALLPVVLAAAVAAPVLSNVDRVVADPDTRVLVCDENGPRVCVTRAHADYLPAIAGPAREALTLLEKLPSPPTSVVELPWEEGARASGGTAPVYFPMGLPDDPAYIRTNIVVGDDTPECWTAGWESRSRLTARSLVASWLTGEPVPGDDDAQRSWQALQALPRAEQAARVAEMRAAVQYCDRDVDLP